MIVLRTPKGWTGPAEVDGVPVEGTFRSHQVPLAELAERPDHLRILEAWMRSYRPEELFDEAGAPVPELLALPPGATRRMSASPHANGGLLLRPLDAARLPRPRRGRLRAGRDRRRGHPGARRLPARRPADRREPRNFRLFGPDETASNRLERGVRGDRPGLGGARRCPPTTTSPRAGG